MGKEVKIGLSVIGALLLVFGGVLYWRLNDTKPRLAANAEGLISATDAEPAADASAADENTADSGQAQDRWNTAVEQSAADYRRRGLQGDQSDDGTANVDLSDDEAAADDTVDPATAQQASSEQGIESDAGAVDPFQRQVANAGAAELADDGAPAQFEPADESQLPLADVSDAESDVSADTTGDSDAIPAAAREPVAGGKSIVKSAAGRKSAVRPARQPVDDSEVSEPAPRRRSYLDEVDTQTAADGAEMYEPAPDETISDGVSSRVEVANGKYTVQPNDNYWIIAEKLYGNAGYFKALQAYNRSRAPQHADGLAVGDSISAPTAEELMKAYPNLCPKPRKLPPQNLARQASSHRPLGAKVYVVEEGDTLFDVARYELGKASRWAEIYDLNRDVLGEDFDYLKPGTKLVLPTERQSEDRMTRQPTNNRLR